MRVPLCHAWCQQAIGLTLNQEDQKREKKYLVEVGESTTVIRFKIEWLKRPASFKKIHAIYL
jgi:hypothetical protein